MSAPAAGTSTVGPGSPGTTIRPGAGPKRVTAPEVGADASRGIGEVDERTARWLALSSAAFVVGLVAVGSSASDRVVPGVPGWSFLLVGAWWGWRPSGRRVGGLMLAAGSAWLTGLALPDPIAASLLDGLSIALIAHLLLAFPGGRLLRRLDRVLASSAYAAAATFALLGVEAGRAAPAVEVVVTIGVAVLSAVGIGVLVRRWSRASPLARRATGPVLLVGIVCLVALIVSLWQEGRAAYLCFVAFFGALPVAFVVGRLRTRLVATRIAELARGLHPGMTTGELSASLATTLGDPALRVEPTDAVDRPPVAEGATDARVLELDDPEAGIAVRLWHDPWWRNEPMQLDAIAGLVLLVLRNGRLQSQLRERARELAVSRARVARAADAERRRMGRDLHDGAQQRLVSASMVLGRLAQRDLEADGARLALEASSLLRAALSDLRELANGLHPSTLVERGLQVAVQELARSLPVATTVRGTLTGRRFDEAAEATAWFVVSEALANVVKHAGARHVEVALTLDDAVVGVRVRDDGTGGADPAVGTGLRGLADRVAATGGSFTVHSPRGGPTIVDAQIPVASGTA